MDQIGDNNDDNNWLDEIALKEAIAGLGQREKKILNLRFFQGKTQVEVAEGIGISHNERRYSFVRCLDAQKGCYDAVFEVGVLMRVRQALTT
jgi:RNA polymerase sporulation-specific sigma factor